MKINSKFIKMGMSGGTLNNAQFKILGQFNPPDEGWESLVIDRELSTKDANLFLLLRGKLALKAQDQIVKNYQLLADFHKEKREPKEEEIKEEKIVASGSMAIYCDGACKGNPGKAGSGLAIYRGTGKPTLLYGEYEGRGTNNTAELNALYKALLIALEEPLNVTIYCDSKYSIDSVSNWAYGWKKKGWTKKSGEIKNLEIIKVAHELYDKLKDKVVLKHVKGHSGVEGNELADRMAVYAIVSKSDGYKRYNYEHVAKVLKMGEG
ncbi:MAG TPA: ribonuclease HI [Campylobacterales bacterium]|nr:ribonuclease HI [Campylobacterales bacterium]